MKNSDPTRTYKDWTALRFAKADDMSPVRPLKDMFLQKKIYILYRIIILDATLLRTYVVRSNDHLQGSNFWRIRNGIAARQSIPPKSPSNARVSHPVLLHLILRLDSLHSRDC